MIKLIDSAEAEEWYDERAVGAAVNAFKRDNSGEGLDVVVVTKIHPRSFREDKLRLAVQKSQQNLVPTIADSNSLPSQQPLALDVVLLHSPRCWRGHCSAEEESHSWQSAWRTLEKVKREGLVTAIGVSNFEVSELREVLALADSKVAVVQNWMDPFQQDREVRRVAASFGVLYMAYSSFGTQWEQKLGRNPVFTSDVLQTIASNHNKTVSQVVISWVLQEDCVAIPRSSNTQHLQTNFEHLHVHDGNTIPFLTNEDMTIIRALDGSVGSLWG